MRVRRLAPFVGVLLLASSVSAKKKEKQALPDVVLRAQTVAVLIQPDAKEPLTDPNANVKAQKTVEEALMKWGRFHLVMEVSTADIVISVEKGSGKAVSQTIGGGPVDSRPVIVDSTEGQIRVGGQKGHPPDATSTNDPSTQDDRVHTGTQAGGSEDVLRLFIGGVEYPLDAGPVWTYSRRDALKAPGVTAVAELRKAFEESEKIAAEREKQKQQQAGKQQPQANPKTP
jgi:hypothetical protein